MEFTACTNAGRHRSINEDSYLVDRESGIYIVADGMGGHKAGEVASALACKTFRASFDDHIDRGDKGKIAQMLKEAVLNANEAIVEKATGRSEYSGMGTTLTAAFLDRMTLYLTHVGDSRAYLVRNGEMTQLTEDHTLVNEMVRRGEVSPDAIQMHPLRHVITKALGTYPAIDADLTTQELVPGDRVILCTDGLTSMLADTDILNAIQQADDIENACGSLIDAANSRGGEDNITIVLIGV